MASRVEMAPWVDGILSGTASRVGLHSEWDGVPGWVGTLGGMTPRVDGTLGGLATLVRWPLGVGWHSEVDCAS